MQISLFVPYSVNTNIFSKLPLRFELLFKHTRIRSVTHRRRTSMRCDALFVETQLRGACQAESETKAKKGANRPGQSRARQSNTESRSGIQKRFGLSAAFSTLSAKFDVALFQPRNDEWANANSETSHPTDELTLGTERNSYAKLAENHRKFGCVSNHSNQPRPDSTSLFNHLVSLLLVAGCVSS